LRAGRGGDLLLLEALVRLDAFERRGELHAHQVRERVAAVHLERLLERIQQLRGAPGPGVTCAISRYSSLVWALVMDYRMYSCQPNVFPIQG
jgi:hypothetical protein